MKRLLKKQHYRLYHTLEGKEHEGANDKLSGDCSGLYGNCTGLSGNCSGLYGDCTGLSGDCSRLSGNCTRLYGDCTGLYGDCTRLYGDLDACEITQEEREKGINIEEITEETC